MQVKHTTQKRRFEILNSHKSTLRSIFMWAKKEKTSHKIILDQIKDRVYDSKFNKYEYLTGVERAILQGYMDCLFDEMWQYVEWVHWYNGKFVGKNLPFGDGFDQLLITESSHVYIGTQNRY